MGEEAYLCLWDLERQALLVALPVQVWPLQARFSPDGRKLAAWFLSEGKHALVVWDLTTGAKAWERPGHAGLAAFCPKGLWTGTRAGNRVLLDPETGAELRRFGVAIWNLALDRTCRYLLVLPLEAPVEVWDLEEERLLGRLPVHGFTHVAGGVFGEGGLAFFIGHLLSDRSLGALVAFHLGHFLGR